MEKGTPILLIGGSPGSRTGIYQANTFNIPYIYQMAIALQVLMWPLGLVQCDIVTLGYWISEWDGAAAAGTAVLCSSIQSLSHPSDIDGLS